jgi:hypothetical protein
MLVVTELPEIFQCSGGGVHQMTQYLCDNTINSNTPGKWVLDLLISDAFKCSHVHTTRNYALTTSLWIKRTDALHSNFIGITTLRVSGSLSAHHQEFLAVHRHWYILCSMMTVCYQERDVHPAPGSKRSSKRHDYRKKLLSTNCVFWFSIQLLSETFFILRRNERDMIKKMYISFHVQCPLFLSDFNEIWIS